MKKEKEMKKKERYEKILNIFKPIFAFPMVATMTGFGFFWYLKLLDYNIWICFILSLYATALLNGYFMESTE